MLVGPKDCEVFTWLLSGDSPARKMMGFGSLDLPPENRPPARRGRWALFPAWHTTSVRLAYDARGWRVGE